MTTPQFRAKQKTVTRRFGWWHAAPGDIYHGVEKAMGLKKGESIVRIHTIRVISATPEPLGAMLDYPDGGHDELAKEGFPFGIRDPREFVDTLARKSGKALDALVNRIEFEYIEESEES